MKKRTQTEQFIIIRFVRYLPINIKVLEYGKINVESIIICQVGFYMVEFEIE
jgi:hypothetical protein